MELKNNKIKFLKYPINFDEKNYGYALCECCMMGDGIQVPRPEETGLIKFNCPNCGKELGIYLTGKNTKDYKDFIDF